ncbi:plasma membrane ascorbate-dependent reductase CYBRD1-like [Oscarella lobularis]|uniref:plasma membrane ascorbate-dependent reductase CYBRD1-like n=1 Tax=Oscarella lobularis TaxID=121494 RepID=UPI0033135812
MSGNFAKPQFVLGLVVVELLLFVLVLPLLLKWLIYYEGGFHWYTKATDQTTEKFFNIHPLCMVLGFIIVLSQGVLVYRVIPGPKIVAKIAHASLHLITSILIILGLVSVWKYHTASGYPHLYTLHSWTGFSAILLFGLQFLFGFLYFLGDDYANIKRTMIPIHRYLGLCILVLSTIASVAGINEKLFFGMGKKHVPIINGSNGPQPAEYPDKPPEAMVGNFLGLALCIAVAAVIFVATRPSFQRKSDNYNDPDREPINKAY